MTFIAPRRDADTDQPSAFFLLDPQAQRLARALEHARRGPGPAQLRQGAVVESRDRRPVRRRRGGGLRDAAVGFVKTTAASGSSVNPAIRGTSGRFWKKPARADGTAVCACPAIGGIRTVARTMEKKNNFMVFLLLLSLLLPGAKKGRPAALDDFLNAARLF